MRKNYILLSIISLFSVSAYATQFTINFVGSTYSPATITAAVGDTINFPASGFHPLVQVDQATWNANNNTPMAGGFGVKTSNYMHVISSASTIWYVCQNHVFGGMKGQINVTVSNLNELIGDNNVKLLSSSLTQNQATVLNTTGLRGKMEIYDLTGKVVNVTDITDEARQLVAVELKRGIYLYHFIMEGNKATATDRLYIGADR